MVFSNITDGSGLIQECERISGLGPAGITGHTPRLKDFTTRINGAIDRFYALIFRYDSNWNYDDRNQTDLPIATTNLVSAQADYQFADELLVVSQVFAKDSSGAWHELYAQDDRENPKSFLTATTGLPTQYDLVGNSIILTPTPNYNSTSGLKVSFKRNGNKFTYTDGSTPLGIPSLFHMYIPRVASLPYLIEKQLPYKNDIAALIQSDEALIKEFMSTRAKPKRIALTPKQENNR